MNEIINNIIKKIRSYKELTDGWDGDGSKSPKKRLLSEAEVFYRSFIFSKKVKTPRVVLSGSGGLFFVWDRDDTCVVIELCGNGTYSCFSWTWETDEELWFNEALVETLIPQEILTLISL